MRIGFLRNISGHTKSKSVLASFFEHRKDGYMNSTEKETNNLSEGAAETVKSKKEIRAEKRAAIDPIGDFVRFAKRRNSIQNLKLSCGDITQIADWSAYNI